MRIRTSVRENHLSVAQMAEVGITEASIAERITADNLGCWVAEHNGTLTGFSMADRLESEVFALFVDPAHEGKGHGSALLRACEDWLLLNGCAEARLNTEPGTRADAFYQRRGWTPTGETSGLFAEDKVMTKRLSRS
ncbi:MAG: GNAT family N-acetyltransferase [Aestuariivirga sp.]|uniref:GNAT family N-acetyltransferase n=1 Tax=Aestuariivirga sp. TaxID=2650926 RepID=UPI0038D033C1